jgi:hypothetical protein
VGTDPIFLLYLEEGKETPGYSHAEKRPCEKAERGWTSTGYGQRPQETPTLLTS